jgi:hypothetical protein
MRGAHRGEGERKSIGTAQLESYGLLGSGLIKTWSEKGWGVVCCGVLVGWWSRRQGSTGGGTPAAGASTAGRCARRSSSCLPALSRSLAHSTPLSSPEPSIWATTS